jgi:uncharacterized protein (DUF58 family)
VRFTYARRTARAALLAVLGAVLYLIAANSGAGWLYVVVATTGAVVLVSVAFPRWNVAGIEGLRRVPPAATAGGAVECTLVVTNRGLFARHLIEVEDRLAGGTGRGVVVRAGRGRPVRVDYEIKGVRRGIYKGGDIALATGAPFGLSHARRNTRAPARLVVYPRTFEVAELPPSTAVDGERGDGSESSVLHRGHGGEFWGLREYRPGDPARFVAWRRSARSLAAGKLAVVELARETHAPLVVAFDLDPSAPPEAREMVVSLGASLLLFGLAEGREVGARAGRQENPFPEEATPESVLTWCAALRPAASSAPAGASIEVRTSTPRSSPEAPAVVLVSCHDFAGPGRWMSPGEEKEFLDQALAQGRGTALVGSGFQGPLRIR